MGLGKFSASLEISAFQTRVSESRARKNKTVLGISYYTHGVAKSVTATLHNEAVIRDEIDKIACYAL